MKISHAVIGLLMTCTVLAGCGGNGSTSSPDEQSKQLQRTDKVQASDYSAELQELYISYYGRPADPAGLAYWDGVLLAYNAPTDLQSLNSAYSTNTAVQTIINSFGNSAESQALYGTGNVTAFVTAIYQNALGRAPDPGGLAYWVGLINENKVTQAQAALAIVAGAAAEPSTSSDEQLVSNRLNAATYFTNQLTTLNVANVYTGTDANINARAMLSAVTSTTSVSSMQAAISNAITTIGNQQIFESFALNGGESSIVYSFPYGGGNLVAGTNYIYASSFNALSQSPLTAGPQPAVSAYTSLDYLLPAQSPGNTRVLQGGQVWLFPSNAQRIISYVGSNIQVQALATDGQTVVRTTQFNNYSVTPLSGFISNSSAELFAAVPLDIWINYNNFSANAQWNSGAAYIKKQGGQVGDFIYIQDCTNTTSPVYTSGTSVTPCQTGTTLDNFFPISLLGGENYFPYETDFSSGGTITSVQGLRMWVATSPLPLGEDLAIVYRVYFEMNGNVYMGTLVKDGTPFLYPQADGSVVNYSLTLNQTAVNSIRQGVITGASAAGSQLGVATTVSQAPDLFGIGGTGVNGSLAPADLRSHYNIPAALTGAGQTIAIVDAPGSGNVSDDLDVFSQYYNLPQCNSANGCFQHIDLSNGAPISASNDFGIEVELDTQMVHAIAPAANILLVTANSNSSTDLFAAVNFAAGRPGVTAVSMSFGSADYSATQDAQFSAYQAAGRPIFFASSGDSGHQSTPQYPALSPWVTAVGGTTITAVNWTASASETAWQYSGGGAVSFLGMPAWQANLITLSIPGANLSGRAVPDVAAVADPQHSAVSVYYKDSWMLAGGTSAAAPIWAGVGALLTQSLANQNKSMSQLISTTQGGFNGLLYGMSPYPQGGNSFYDIVTGSNNLTTTPCSICSASPGYDYVTGLGAPNVANMAVYLGALSTP